MKFNIKNLAIILCGVASCNAMQFNNNFNNQNNIFNNQFNNNMNNQNGFRFNNNNNNMGFYNNNGAFNNNMFMNNVNNMGINNMNMRQNMSMNNANMMSRGMYNNMSIGMNNNANMMVNQFQNRNQIYNNFNNNMNMYNSNNVNMRMNNNINMNTNNNAINNQLYQQFWSIMKNYIKQKIFINNNGIQLNCNNVNQSDYNLFETIVKTSQSAKTNILTCLNSLIKEKIERENGKIDFIGYQVINDALYDFIKHKITNDNVKSLPGDNSLEFILVIAGYYIDCIHSGVDIDQVQKNLLQLNINNPYQILMQYGYKNYYSYYEKKISYAKNMGAYINAQLSNITANEIKYAIQKIKEIDLANVIKQLIIGVNVGEILFDKELEETSNDVSSINPMLLNNGNCQCWFVSALQLINSAVECATQEIKNKLTSKTGYVLVKFLEYLKNKSKNWFVNNNDEMLDITYNNRIGLSLHKELQNFENKLDNISRESWNSIPGVQKAKESAFFLNEKLIASNSVRAFSLWGQIFPEISEILYKNWDDLTNDEWDKLKYTQDKVTYMNNIRNTCFSIVCQNNTDKVPENSCSYFLMTGHGVNGDSNIKDQLPNNKWKIGFDKNNNFVLYTVRGLHLMYPGHYYAHVALNNTNNNWHFADTTGHNSNPKFHLNMFSIINNELLKQQNCAIQTFMYRKMTNEEIMQYINK